MELSANQSGRMNMQAASSMPTLRFGDSGDAVRVLQRLLLSNGYDVGVDGTFAALTETAIKAFQDQRGLQADGVVGQGTWRELTLSL